MTTMPTQARRKSDTCQPISSYSTVVVADPLISTTMMTDPSCTSISSGSSGSSSPSTASSLSSACTTTATTVISQPEAKRSKTAATVVELAYPTDVPRPSRGLIQSLFEEAVQDSTNNNDDGDQQCLQDAGLLSFRQVILPALAYEEERALKQWQSKIQRDHPALKSCVVQARKAVYGAVGGACHAVRENAVRRQEQRRQREAEWRRQAEDTMQQMREEAEQQLLATQTQLQRELKMKLPANQSLWREEAYLMTQLSKLNTEEQQWKDAAVVLSKQEAALEAEEKKLAERVPKTDELMATSKDQDGENNDNHKYTAPPEVLQVVETATDIRLSALRIKNALQVVAGTVEETEQVRKALYKQYCRDHQFHGYQGIHDPKGLLRVLSQSQKDD